MNSPDEIFAELAKDSEPIIAGFRRMGRHDIADVLLRFDREIAEAASKARNGAVYTRTGLSPADPAEPEIRRLRKDRDEVYAVAMQRLSGQ